MRKLSPRRAEAIASLINTIAVGEDMRRNAMAAEPRDRDGYNLWLQYTLSAVDELKSAHGINVVGYDHFTRQDWVEVPTDKAGVLVLLNSEERNESALRCWMLTPRGGLVEQPVEKS